jgi:hypothetical protein
MNMRQRKVSLYAARFWMSSGQRERERERERKEAVI